MTDAVAAAAAEAAPADTHVAAIEDVTAPPAPLSDAPQPLKDQQQEQPKAAPTTREALRAAAAKVNAQEEAAAKAAADAKDPKATPPKRDDTTGKFAAKDPKAADPAAAAPAAKDGKDPAAAAAAPPAKPAAAPPAPANRTVTAPERFSNDAKAVWDTAPEPVKAEVDRMHREMTAGQRLAFIELSRQLPRHPIQLQILLLIRLRRSRSISH